MVAAILNEVLDMDTMSTAAAAMVGIHCALPRVEEVGGGSDEGFYSCKVSGKICVPIMIGIFFDIVSQ